MRTFTKSKFTVLLVRKRAQQSNIANFSQSYRCHTRYKFLLLKFFLWVQFPQLLQWHRNKFHFVILNEHSTFLRAIQSLWITSTHTGLLSLNFKLLLNKTHLAVIQHVIWLYLGWIHIHLDITQHIISLRSNNSSDYPYCICYRGKKKNPALVQPASIYFLNQ